MIRVDELTKTYGFTHALRGISFGVERGEVIGFLGPNGAGKSTTMKILTGFLLPTSGTATVDGLDVVAQSLAVRRKIGYLPESTPLYTEMRVDDYLRFAAEIRGVPGRNLRHAVARVVDLCNLDKVLGKNIIELSKGYKQRVGLAQAMVHDPDVLVLDEPTSGLDPNQIVDVRELIKRLAERHTIILSTHYLQEVEASCTRVIIVSQGRIVADDTNESLCGRLPGGAVRLRVKGAAPDAVQRQLTELLHGVRVVAQGQEDGVTAWRIEGVPPRDGVMETSIADIVVKNGWGLIELQRERATLEDVFRTLTLEESREAGDA